MKELNFITRVNNQRLPKGKVFEIQNFITSNDGKLLEITIKRARSKRSLQQNKYYHAVIVPIICEALKDLGHDLNKVECHEWLKMKFNYESIADKNGNHIADIPKSTTKLTKTEFSEFVEQVSQWCAEHLNLVIPEPNSQLQLIEQN